MVPGCAKSPPCLLLAQLVMAAGLPAGALNVLTGSDSSLGAKVARSSSINYVTYGGNKQVCVYVCVRAWHLKTQLEMCWLSVSNWDFLFVSIFPADRLA